MLKKGTKLCHPWDGTPTLRKKKKKISGKDAVGGSVMRLHLSVI